MINDPSWQTLLKDELQSDYFQKILSFLDGEVKNGKTILPDRANLFKAFELTPFDQVKVVIIGQDPYHNIGQAHGLAFSVQKSCKIPPSLLNIYKELENSTNFTRPKHGYLEQWAVSGVLLLNAILSVEHNLPSSHKDIGWQRFTDSVIGHLSTQRKHLVFLLWGNYARSKKHLIDESKHLVIESAHPSPLSASRGFFGSNCFVKTNEYLKATDQEMIEWQIK